MPFGQALEHIGLEVIQARRAHGDHREPPSRPSGMARKQTFVRRPSPAPATLVAARLTSNDGARCVQDGPTSRIVEIASPTSLSSKK